MSLVFIADGAPGLYDRFADHIFALGGKSLQVAVVAGFQYALAVAYINRVGGFIDQRTHEFELVVEGALGPLALLDLATHVGVPEQ